MGSVNISALILAAGFSKRMGEFKPLLPIGNISALERLIDSYRQAGVADIFVVTGHNQEALQPVIEKVGAKEVYNKDFALGMFSSVKAGIKAVAEGAEMGRGAGVSGGAGLLLHPVDTPLVKAETIRAFIEAAGGQTDRFAVPCFLGKKGHPLFIPVKFFQEILSHSGDRGLKGITSKYDENMFRFETEDESVVLDMDTKEAYMELLSHFNKKKGLLESIEDNEKKRIILVRHGEIKQHKEKIFLGQYDPPLSDRGMNQAEEAAEVLAEMHLSTDKIYTSDLKRARETARIIGGALDLEIVEEADFREMSLGAWDGKYISEIRMKFPELYKRRGLNLLTFKIDNESENYYDLRYRVLKGFAKILEQDGHDDMLIISHGGVIRALLSILRKSSLEEELKTSVKNGEIITLEC